MTKRIRTKSTTEQLREILDKTDAVLIGAGAGLSTSAGFVYDGERFRKYFADFEEKYGFHDMYSGGFYPYKTLEEYWAYWSRYVFLNRYSDAPKRFTPSCTSSSERRITLSLPPMWTTAFKRPDLTKSVSSIRREITVCGSAQGLLPENL